MTWSRRRACGACTRGGAAITRCLGTSTTSTRGSVCSRRTSSSSTYFNQKQYEPYKLALNKFGDMSSEEFRNAYYTGSKIYELRSKRGSRKDTGAFIYEGVEGLPASVDWRAKGAAAEVKNQGHCGEPNSCNFVELKF